MSAGVQRRVQPHLAGTWYAGDPLELRRQVDALLASAVPSPLGAVRALIAPHAAYPYSGRAAGAAYVLLRRQKVTRLLLLAPSHYHGFRGAAVPDFARFETPLGAVAIDVESCQALAAAQGLIRRDAKPYEKEHAVEIQLPFVQRVAPGAAVIPLLIGRLEAADSEALAQALTALLPPADVIVVSSDFTHYGAAFGYLPFPARDATSVAAELAALDRGAIEPVVEVDAEGFERYVEATGATICGRVPIGVLLRMLRGGPPGRLLSYYTSLDVTGDFTHSVSYAAIAFGEDRTD